jgi:intraflagellar transport protein 81
MQWQQGLVQGDKRVIYPIIYFLVTRFQDCEKRAYLAKFLVPFEVQEDLQGDQDIKNMHM